MDRLVHRIMWGSHGDLQISCTEKWERAGWVQEKDLPKGIHNTDTGMLYSFEKSLVTCPTCKSHYDSQERSNVSSD